MGALEKKARERRKKENLQKAALSALKVAGTLSLAAIAPKMLTLLKRSGSVSSTKTRAVIDRLVAKKLAKENVRGGQSYYRLTPEGERVLELDREIQSLLHKKKQRWDGLWRIVIFDIPEPRRRIRKELVSLLREVGFVKIQNSVWVFPYDCEELLALIKTDGRLGKEVLYVVASSLEGDGMLEKHFKLNSHI